jgi:hypothetical protein
MTRYLLPLALILTACSPKAAENVDYQAEEKAIRDLLMRQEVAWNQGKIDEFMEGYWKSDSLMFIGTAITYSWNATLERYHKNYPDRATMGTLKFTFYEFKFIDADACMVTGKYQLKREIDEPSGMFTLLLKKKENGWVIVYDHTS